MPLYQFVTICASKNEKGLQLDTLSDLVWSPSPELVIERAALMAAYKFPGTALQGTNVNAVDIGKNIANALRYAWIKYKLRF